ncbi:MAG: hypothetical protein L0K41_05600, partial [Yaniella sp.]|nr:hypothetical protein [Yaniella sp.]
FTAESGWRAALSTWGLVALIPTVLWLVIARRIGYDYPQNPAHAIPTKRMYRSSAAWAMTAFYALQSTQVYVQFGWLPQIYRDAGISSTEAGLLLAATLCVRVERYHQLIASQPVHIGREPGIPRKCRM